MSSRLRKPIIHPMWRWMFVLLPATSGHPLRLYSSWTKDLLCPLTSAVLAEDGVVNKLKTVADEGAIEEWEDNPVALLDADFALLAGTRLNLLERLKASVGGYAV